MQTNNNTYMYTCVSHYIEANSILHIDIFYYSMLHDLFPVSSSILYPVVEPDKSFTGDNIKFKLGKSRKFTI